MSKILDCDAHARDYANEQTAPLAADAVFEGAFTRIDHYAHVELLYAATTPFTAQKIWSNDGITPLGGDFGTSTLTQQVVQGYNVVYDVMEGRNIAPYYKLKITNGATPQTAYPGFISLAWLIATAYQGSFGTLNAALNNLSRAILTRAVLAGFGPNGEFINQTVGGTLTLAPAVSNLGSGATYTSNWFSCEGWNGLFFTVVADQVSGSNGIEVEFGPDSSTVRSVRRATFSAADVAAGSKVFAIAPRDKTFRLKYTNGGVAQATFYVHIALNTVQVQDSTDNVESDLSATSSATMVRAILGAKNDLGAYGNILRGALGGLRISVLEHEADTPIKALTNFQTNQANVGTSATQIVGSPLTGRKTVAIKALSGNNAKVYVGLSGVTTGSGFELDARDFIIMEIDASAPSIYAIAVAGTQRVCWAEIA